MLARYLVGSLVPLGKSATTGAAPVAIVIEPTGRWAYVLNGDRANASISQYAIDPSDGHLEPLAAASVATGSFPRALVVDPSGRYVYVPDVDTCQLYQYGIGPTGALGPLTPATAGVANCVAQTDLPALAADPSGRFLYVIGSRHDSALIEYGIGGGGALAPLSPAATATLTGTQLGDVAVALRYQ